MRSFDMQKDDGSQSLEELSLLNFFHLSRLGQILLVQLCVRHLFNRIYHIIVLFPVLTVLEAVPYSLFVSKLSLLSVVSTLGIIGTNVLFILVHLLLVLSLLNSFESFSAFFFYFEGLANFVYFLFQLHLLFEGLLLAASLNSSFFKSVRFARSKMLSGQLVVFVRGRIFVVSSRNLSNFLLFPDELKDGCFFPLLLKLPLSLPRFLFSSMELSESLLIFLDLQASLVSISPIIYVLLVASIVIATLYLSKRRSRLYSFQCL